MNKAKIISELIEIKEFFAHGNIIKSGPPSTTTKEDWYREQRYWENRVDELINEILEV